jgi:hypothetical protein
MEKGMIQGRPFIAFFTNIVVAVLAYLVDALSDSLSLCRKI